MQENTKRLFGKRTAILFAFLSLKFALQYFLVDSAYDLHRDEFLHLDQGRHLAWGYLSVPPFTSWTSYVILLLGNSVFWVKFFPALYGALTLWMVWKAIEVLKGTLFAQVLGASCVLLSALLRLNMLYQPNSFDVLSWTALYFILIQYIATQNRKWWFAAAFVFALGFLNKYNIVFLLIGLFPALLLTEHRRLFRTYHVYAAIGVALLLVSPNLVWQYHHGFPVIHHLRELSETQLEHVNRIDFLKNQLLFFAGGLVVLFASFYALLFYPPYRRYRPFLFAIVFTLAAFVYCKAKDYYAIGIYPIYIAFGAVYLGDVLRDGWKKKYLQPLLLLLPVLLFLPLYNVAFPNRSPQHIVQHPEAYKRLGMLRWEDGNDHALPQDFADMLGWNELAQKVDRAYSKLHGHTLILCDNYGQAGAINYYTQQQAQAVSFNADYINWFDLSKRYDNVIRVKEAGNTATELQETGPFFEQAVLADSITNSYAREFGTSVFVFTGARIDVRKRIKEEIEEVSWE
ncbi:MAG TPA: glycosyltransferase family 39 protein [Flavobacterium sp.]|nr:glycosyltransferase family 39 protein [Flavobacterium sp.]